MKLLDVQDTDSERRVWVADEDLPLLLELGRKTNPTEDDRLFVLAVLDRAVPDTPPPVFSFVNWDAGFPAVEPEEEEEP